MTTRYQEAAARAEAYNRAIVAKARKLTKEAGLDPELLGIHPHNAMVDLHYGHPWKGVDYNKVREVLYLLDDVQWRAHRAVEKWTNAVYARLGNSKGYDYLHRDYK